MEVLYLILALVWSILCLILFFKIWGMTNDIRQIKDHLLGTGNGYVSNNSALLKVGDIAKVLKTNEKVMIAEINSNGCFKCIDPVTHKLIGEFSANELEK